MFWRLHPNPCPGLLTHLFPNLRPQSVLEFYCDQNEMSEQTHRGLRLPSVLDRTILAASERYRHHHPTSILQRNSHRITFVKALRG